MRNKFIYTPDDWRYKDKETGEIFTEEEYRDIKAKEQKEKQRRYVTRYDTYKVSKYDIYPFEVDFNTVLKEAFDPVQGTGIIRGCKL